MTVISDRQLNRTFLHRQGLLGRWSVSPGDVVRRLAGVQAQDTTAPYIGIWCRIGEFERNELSLAIHNRDIVRATVMRSTLHFVDRADYLAWWNALQPAFAKSFRGFFGKSKSLDVESVAAEAAAFMSTEAHTFAAMREHLSKAFPDVDPPALTYAARTYVPMVESTSSGMWRFRGSPEYILASHDFGADPGPAPDGLIAMFNRYLAAFGPASIADFQTWSGLTGLARTLGPLREQYQIYRSEDGRELWDRRGAEVIGEDADVPVRLVAGFDNAVLGHKDRSRIIDDEARKNIFRGAGIVDPTFLVDGHVGGRWKLVRSKTDVEVRFTPFVLLRPDDRSRLSEEAERLMAWTDPDLTPAVRFDTA